MRAPHVVTLVAILSCPSCVAGDRPAGPRDAAPDAPPPPCMYDGSASPRCDRYDASALDLGPPDDAGPFVSPTLAPRPDLGAEPPGVKNGCLELQWCTTGGGAGLTYDNFAHDFFRTYCVRCHSTTNVGETARHGAPPCYNWDDRASINAHLDLIREDVAAVNYMPFDNPTLLPCDRRRQMAEWIDNGAP